MKRCPACQASYPDDDRFCETDGETLVADDPVRSVPTLPVSPPPSDVPVEDTGRRLLEVAPELGPARIGDLVNAALDLAERFERDRLAWQPQAEDFVIRPDGSLGIRQARGVFRRTGSFDARPVMRALGEALLPGPLGLASPGLVRLLTDPRLPPSGTAEARALARAGERPRVVGDRVGLLADLGYRRERQEDALDAHAARGQTLLVLCDGVSASADGRLAATVGVEWACRHGAAGIEQGERGAELVRESIRAAHEAVCRASSDVRTSEAPGATIVVALVEGRRVAIGWAGDSRAYLFAEGRDECLTRDHSWANEMLASGEVTEEEAFAQPLAHALTRCIGPLEDGLDNVDPDVRTVELPPGAVLVLCSDGVWSYFATAEAMGATVRRAGRDPSAVAQVLVHEALLSGGHDNASVAVYVSS